MVEDVMDGNILNNLYNTEERTNWWPCKTFDLRIATFWQRFGWTFILRRADGFKIVWWSTEISMPTLTQNNISRKLCVKSNFCYDSGDSNDFNVNTLASGERLRLSKACRSPALTCSQRMEDIVRSQQVETKNSTQIWWKTQDRILVNQVKRSSLTFPPT